MQMIVEKYRKKLYHKQVLWFIIASFGFELFKSSEEYLLEYIFIRRELFSKYEQTHENHGRQHRSGVYILCVH